MQSVDKTLEQMRKRQDKTRGLVSQPEHRYISLSIETTWAAYGASAQILKDLKPLVQMPNEAKLSVASLDGRFPPRTSRKIQRVIQSGEDLAAGKDEEVVKNLTWRLVAGTVKWGTKLLPVRAEDFKDAAELLEALGDLRDIGGVAKERRKQAAVAAKFLLWSQATALTAMAWAVEAQRLHDLLSNHTPRNNQALIADVQQRMVLETIRWERWFK
jgi:hypothetical protein